MHPTIKLLATLTVTLAPLALADRAQAQYGGFGGFGGFGFGYNQNAYRDVNFLNSRSLVNASIAGANRPQPVQAPVFPVRDESIYDRYDTQTREAMMNRVARDPAAEMSTVVPGGTLPPPRSSSPRPKAPAGPSEPTTVNLANYFDKDQHLVWPSMSPITGDFGKKQEVADLATLAVLNEYNMKGLARVSTVTDARQKLLDYGRPALQYVREHSTPALSDTFHVFLLSLYGNLGNAATVPKSP